MSDEKVTVKVRSVVVPVGTKVLDDDGKKVGEVVDWRQAEDGRVEVTATVTDPDLIEKIKAGGRQTFSMGTKIDLEPKTS